MPNAVITGGSRGLGLALARALAAEGWGVIVDARTAGELDRAARDTPQAGKLVAITGDVTDAAHRAVVVDAVRNLGSVDLLVNNASVLGPSPQPTLARYPIDVLEEVYRVNAIAPLALTQTLLPDLRSSHGIVVNVTSDASVEPYEGWGGYGSSKAALDQLSAVLGAEEPDIRVYALDPGDMRTKMHQDAFPGEDISDRPEPETVVPTFKRLITERPPSGRYRAADFAVPEKVPS